MRSSKRFRGACLVGGALAVGLAIAPLGCTIKDDPTPSQTLLTPEAGTSKLNGDWLPDCVAASDGSSDRTVLTFEDKDELITYLHWDSPVSDCSGMPTTVDSYAGKISLVSTKDVTWDGTTPTGLPDALTATAFSTSLKDSIDSGGQTLTKLLNVGVIDENAKPRVLYLGSTLDTTISTDSTDGYPTVLDPDGYAED